MENVDDIYPLSPMQRLMLMHSIRVPGSSTLSNQFRYRVSGRLDAGRFDDAWRHVIHRHAALRTAFAWEGVNEPLQVVRSTVHLPVKHISLDGLGADEKAQQLAQLEQADRQRGFNLTRAPLMRLTVIRLREDEHILLWSRHHLILDLWSVERLFDEVFKNYVEAQTPGEEATGFRDYIEWLGHQNTADAETYYRHSLRGLGTPALLFGERARRSEWSRQGQPVAERVLSAETVATVSDFARTNGLTFGSVVQGGVGLMIAKRLRRDDVLFGLTVAGRPSDLDNVESILGTFINNVPVRATIDRTAKLDDWLAKLQAAQAARQPYEYLSPIDIQRCSEIPAERPLFDLLLLLQAPGATRLPGHGALTLEPLRGPFDSALPMTLAVEHEGSEARLTAVYDDAVVAPDTASDMLRHLEEWLQLISTRGDDTLAELLPAAGPATTPARKPIPAQDPVDSDIAADILLDIWRRTLGFDDIGLDDDFFAIGGTSIQAAIAFSEIEQRLGRELPLSTLFEAGSVRALLKTLDEPPGPASSLVSIQRRGHRPTVLACSGIGGNVVGLYGIARALGDGQPFYGLQPAALSDDAAPTESVEKIAADYIAASEPVRSGPVVLLGICFGAHIMLEIAQRLSKAGHPPALLIVMDPVFGDGEQPAPPGPKPTLAGYLRDTARLHVATYRSLEPADRRTWFKSKVSALWNRVRHGDPLRGSRLVLRQRRVEAANIAAAERYNPARYDGETRVLMTTDRILELADDPRKRWMSAVAPAAEVVTVPGNDTGDAVNHHAAVVADCIRSWIDDVT
ncbi:MAG: alpha/beta fold hydrolase [Gammaproteobacteria bacterium]|nr:alpha/beta fold hydrolase [Gammaproteobacteria bacterium]